MGTKPKPLRFKGIHIEREGNVLRYPPRAQIEKLKSRKGRRGPRYRGKLIPRYILEIFRKYYGKDFEALEKPYRAMWQTYFKLKAHAQELQNKKGQTSEEKLFLRIYQSELRNVRFDLMLINMQYEKLFSEMFKRKNWKEKLREFQKNIKTGKKFWLEVEKKPFWG